ncbi:GAF domain-containing protein [Streptomyces sp. NPDC001135]
MADDASSGSEAPEDPDRTATARSLGVHSVLVAPMHERGVRLGVATFLRSRSPDPFGPDDVSLADELVARAAVCIDNARRFTRERSTAAHPGNGLHAKGASQPHTSVEGFAASTGKPLSRPAHRNSPPQGPADRPA